MCQCSGHTPGVETGGGRHRQVHSVEGAKRESVLHRRVQRRRRPTCSGPKKKGCFVLFCFYSTESFSPDVSTPAGRADGRAHSLPADTDPGSQPSSGSFWAEGTCPGPLGESAPPKPAGVTI